MAKTLPKSIIVPILFVKDMEMRSAKKEQSQLSDSARKVNNWKDFLTMI